MFAALWRGIKAISKKVWITAAFLAVFFIVVSTWIGVSNAMAAFRPPKWNGLDLTAQQRATVSGNGGPAVMVGNWLYFVGNYVETDRIRYRQNEHNNVTYGAIYRVYIPEGGEPLYEDASKVNEFPNLYTQHLLDKTQYHLVVPKVAGFDKAALWIFDEHLIYTSPNNGRDRRGNLQTKRLDFFRVDLDGRNHRRLYTTSSDAVEIADFTVASLNSQVYILIKDGQLFRRISVTERPGQVTTVSRSVSSQHGIALPVVTSYRTDFDSWKGEEMIGLPGFPVFDDYSLANSYQGIMGYVYYTESLSEEESKLGLTGIKVFQYDVLNDKTVEVRVLDHTVHLHGLSNGRLLYTLQEIGADFAHGLFALNRIIDADWKVPFSGTPVGTGITKLLAGERWDMRSDSVFWQTENAPHETHFRYALVRSGTMHLYSSDSQDHIAVVPGVAPEDVIRVCRQYVHYLDGTGNFAAVELHNGAEKTLGRVSRTQDASIEMRTWVVGRGNMYWHFFIRDYAAECGEDHDHNHDSEEVNIAMLADLWSARQRDFEQQFVFILGRLDCKFLNNPDDSHDGCCDR